MNETTTNFNWMTKPLPDGSLSITGYKGKDSSIIIPAKINGMVVTEIADEALWGNEQVTELTVSEGITRIGNSAFHLCGGLNVLHLPATLTHIHHCAFAMCNSLQKLFIPKNVAFIGQDAFAMCEKLVDIEVSPDNKVFIVQNGILYNKESKAVVTCSKAVSGKVYLPNDTFGISSYAFSGCNQVTEFVLPGGLRYIGENAFSWCEKIERVFIPDSVTCIEALAFDSCTRLREVSIFENLKYEKGSFCPFDQRVNIHVRNRLGQK